MNSKRFLVIIISVSLCLLVIVGSINAMIDPYFHYHAPLDNMSYRFADERYVNDGILRHFDYDGVIIGTSMTENSKASEAEMLFGGSFVKTPFSGEYYKEINERLKTALKTHQNIKTVIRGLDAGMVLNHKDSLCWDSYPTYLYDDLILNDVEYLFNKSVLIKDSLYMITYTKEGNQTTDFDSYANWMEGRTFGKDAVLSQYERPQKEQETESFDDKYQETVKGNVEQNIVDLMNEYPNVEFYLFITPYSICFFDKWNQEGKLALMIDAMEYEAELLLKCNNVHLFSFFDDTNMICDFENYKDPGHYGEWVNSWILQWMAEGKHELTEDNYRQYYQSMREFYLNYDYESIFIS